jgi:transposase InsO family protein
MGGKQLGFGDYEQSTAMKCTKRERFLGQLKAGQYRAIAYQELLATHGITCSMSAKGCGWDNAVVESLFSTLKHELGLDDDVETSISPQQMQRDLAFWIDGYYNRERRHSTLNDLGDCQER